MTEFGLTADTSEAPAARLYLVAVGDAANTSEAPAARLYLVAVGDAANTSEAPAARRAHARCAPRSVTSLLRCGAYVACARLAAAPSNPAPTARHRTSHL